jgi:hypothetical protein
MILDLLRVCRKVGGRTHILFGQEGIATGTVMLIAFLMSAIALGVLGLSSTISARDLKYLYFQNSLEIIHTNIYAFGQNDYAFKKTLDKNYLLGRMKCIKEWQSCSTPSYTQGNSAFEKVTLINPDGSPYYDLGTPTVNGFGLDGRPCAFNASKVVNGCALQLDIRWTPFCNNVPCKIGTATANRLIFWIYYKAPTYYLSRSGINYSIKNYLPVDTKDLGENRYVGPMRIIMNPYR